MYFLILNSLELIPGLLKILTISVHQPYSYQVPSYLDKICNSPPKSAIQFNFLTYLLIIPYLFQLVFLHTSPCICKRLQSPGFDSLELLLPAYLAWRVSTTTLFLLSSQSPYIVQIFQHQPTKLYRLAESIPGNRILDFINVCKYGLSVHCDILGYWTIAVELLFFLLSDYRNIIYRTDKSL